MMKLFYIVIACLLVSCGVIKIEYPSKDEVARELNKQDDLIRDCPEEMIINLMPKLGPPDPNSENRYYIYKGKSRRLNEFDSAWVNANCRVKTTTVY